MSGEVARPKPGFQSQKSNRCLYVPSLSPCAGGAQLAAQGIARKTPRKTPTPLQWSQRRPAPLTLYTPAYRGPPTVELTGVSRCRRELGGAPAAFAAEFAALLGPCDRTRADCGLCDVVGQSPLGGAAAAAAAAGRAFGRADAFADREPDPGPLPHHAQRLLPVPRVRLYWMSHCACSPQHPSPFFGCWRWRARGDMTGGWGDEVTPPLR